jgi:hypothetical protein
MPEAVDMGAELTLQIARLVQTRPDATRSPNLWSFWPHGGSATWAEARALLAAAPKPVAVAPLVEPGAIGIFPVEQLPDAVRRQLAPQFEGQLEYYRQKLEQMGLAEGASLRFEPAAPQCVLSIAEFMSWARDYAIGVGISLGPSPDPAVGRIIVRPPSGGRAPLGA